MNDVFRAEFNSMILPLFRMSSQEASSITFGYFSVTCSRFWQASQNDSSVPTFKILAWLESFLVTGPQILQSMFFYSWFSHSWSSETTWSLQKPCKEHAEHKDKTNTDCWHNASDIIKAEFEQEIMWFMWFWCFLHLLTVKFKHNNTGVLWKWKAIHLVLFPYKYLSPLCDAHNWSQNIYVLFLMQCGVH